MNFQQHNEGAIHFLCLRIKHYSGPRLICACIFWLLPLAASLCGQAEPTRTDKTNSSQPNSKSDFGPTPALTPAEIQEGWLSLFDGESLFGWHAATKADWSAKDGCLEVSSGEPGLLRSSVEFDDFELRLDAKIGPQTNSGIFLHTSPRPTDPAIDCIEFNLANRAVSPFPTGSLVKRSTAKIDCENEGWMSIRIVVEGTKIQGWVNGILCCNHEIGETEKALRRGYVGLQFNSGPASFRNIRIRPLKLSELKINQKLEGWSQRESRQSRFSVSNGELRIQGGPGQLESEEAYTNFILSMECKTHKPGMNSGIFFRSIPGEWMNGYESQIDCGFENGDRSKPRDCGTGGIFRRQNARLVNSDDKVWFRKTIIACGPQISVWVNGYQVTDWSDRRAPDPNPRKGRRLEGGAIILQGHDPKTDVSFRNIQLRELQARKR